MDRDFDTKDGGWFPVMHDLAEKLITTDLTKTEGRVLWMFFRYCYGYNKPSCEFQWKDMKDITGFGDGSLSKAISRLKQRNIIQTFHTESKTYITYRINSKISTWKAPLSIRKDFPYGKQTLHKRKVNASRMESTPIKDNIKTKDNSALLRNFLSFYEKYPLKKSKKKAEEVWLRISMNGGFPPLENILAALDSQIKEKESLVKSNKFCPEWKHPSTWLNQECWNDECIICNDAPFDMEKEKQRISSELAARRLEKFKQRI